jgi:hypothetical protein
MLKACTSNSCSILFISGNGYYWESPQISQPIIRYLQGVVLRQLCKNSRAVLRVIKTIERVFLWLRQKASLDVANIVFLCILLYYFF